MVKRAGWSFVLGSPSWEMDEIERYLRERRMSQLVDYTYAVHPVENYQRITRPTRDWVPLEPEKLLGRSTIYLVGLGPSPAVHYYEPTSVPNLTIPGLFYTVGTRIIPIMRQGVKDNPLIVQVYRLFGDMPTQEQRIIAEIEYNPYWAYRSFEPHEVLPYRLAKLGLKETDFESAKRFVDETSSIYDPAYPKVYIVRSLPVNPLVADVFALRNHAALIPVRTEDNYVIYELIDNLPDEERETAYDLFNSLGFERVRFNLYGNPQGKLRIDQARETLRFGS